ncbi:hypothetical protein ACFWN2_40165 [Lentzea sp. NPDC058436]|uniref:hypothetical protein n=1 Tax=Lentzea sp. NPDC058436 TaxID=3346499 RepID=UPI0036544798
MSLLDDETLWSSSVVANCEMNCERGLARGGWTWWTTTCRRVRLLVRADGTPLGRVLTKALRDNGFNYDSRRRLVSWEGDALPRLPFAYLGADDRVGPNYTGQPAVHSCYEPL